jgi:hypothetical protein
MGWKLGDLLAASAHLLFSRSGMRSSGWATLELRAGEAYLQSAATEWQPPEPRRRKNRAGARFSW